MLCCKVPKSSAIEAADALLWDFLCRCFAAVSVSMQTYDRLVVYSPRQSADAQVSQPSTAHASSSSERHLSSSRERSPHERSQQPACCSRETTEQGARHVQSRPASEDAQQSSSIARQDQAAKGRDIPGALGDREFHTSSYRKRRRFSSRQPSAEPSDQTRSGNGHHRPSEQSREAADGPNSLAEHSQHPVSMSVAVRCSVSESSRPASSTGEKEPRHKDRRKHQSCDALEDRLQHRSPQGEHRKTGPQSHGGAERSSLANSEMLAELRERALAAVRAHREHG